MTLYEIFFELEVGMCERFPALTPFEVRRQRAHEVFLLISRLYGYNKNNSKPKQIRKPAGDNWF